MGDERAISELSGDIQGAQASLMQTIEQEPQRWWNARQLRAATRNGREWPGDILTFALTDLVNQGKLELGSDLQVRLKAF